MQKDAPDQKLSFSGEVIGESLVLATHLHLSSQARRLAAHAEREQWLRALAVDHSGFLQDRLDNFVGQNLVRPMHKRNTGKRPVLRG